MAYDPGSKYYNADWAKLDAAGLSAKRNEVIKLAQEAKKAGNTKKYNEYRSRIEGLDSYASYAKANPTSSSNPPATSAATTNSSSSNDDDSSQYVNSAWDKLDSTGLAAKQKEISGLLEKAKAAGNQAEVSKWQTRLNGFNSYMQSKSSSSSSSSQVVKKDDGNVVVGDPGHGGNDTSDDATTQDKVETNVGNADVTTPEIKLDPNTEIGRILSQLDLSQFSPDQQSAVANVLTQMNQFGKSGEALADEFIKKEDYANLSPETTEAVRQAMANAQELYGKSGITSDELSGIQALKDTFEKAGVRSEDMQAALDRMKELSQGYDTAQNRALREEAITGMDSDYQTKLAQLRAGAANQGVRGRYLGAQVAQLDKTDQSSRNSFNRQWLADNAQVQATNSQAYSNTLNSVLGREQSDKQKAAEAYNTGANTTYTNVNARQGQAADRVSNLAAADQSRRDAVAEYNNQQNQAYASGRMTSLLGTIGTMMGSVGNEQGAKSAAAFQDWLKDYYSKTLAISSKATDAYSDYMKSQISGSTSK